MKMDRNNPNEVCNEVYYFEEIKISKSMPQENWNSKTNTKHEIHMKHKTPIKTKKISKLTNLDLLSNHDFGSKPKLVGLYPLTKLVLQGIGTNILIWSDAQKQSYKQNQYKTLG